MENITLPGVFTGMPEAKRKIILADEPTSNLDEANAKNSSWDFGLYHYYSYANDVIRMYCGQP